MAANVLKSYWRIRIFICLQSILNFSFILYIFLFKLIIEINNTNKMIRLCEIFTINIISNHVRSILFIISFTYNVTSPCTCCHCFGKLRKNWLRFLFNCVGCAFVTYTSKQCAINAIRTMHQSHTMEVRIAYFWLTNYNYCIFS